MIFAATAAGDDACTACADRTVTPLRNRPCHHVLLDRGPDTDLNHPLRINQSFIDRMVEWRTVRIGLAEIVRPRIHMRIEMHQPDRMPQPFRQRAQQRQRNPMLPTQRDQMPDRLGL